jgi:hypothetical protein
MSEEHVRPDLEMLADYLEGLLTEPERAEVERAVAADPSTAALLAELEELPALLAAHPPEPMPAEVAARIDAAIADEAASSTAAASSPDKLAPVRPLAPRRRRWLAPALVAAAAVGVVGLGSQVINSGMGSGADEESAAMDSGGGEAEETADQSDSAPEAGSLRRPREELAELSALSFAEDVADTLSKRPQTYARDRVAGVLRRSETLDLSVGSIVGATCATDLPSGRVLPVRLDGEAALLVLRRVPGEPDQRDVLAYPARCPSPTAGEGPAGELAPLASTRLPVP